MTGRHEGPGKKLAAKRKARASEAVKYYRDTSEPLRYYRKNHSFKHSTEHQKCNFFKLCRDTHLRWPKMLKHMIGDMFLQKSEVNMLADH